MNTEFSGQRDEVKNGKFQINPVVSKKHKLEHEKKVKISDISKIAFENIFQNF